MLPLACRELEEEWPTLLLAGAGGLVRLWLQEGSPAGPAYLLLAATVLSHGAWAYFGDSEGGRLPGSRGGSISGRGGGAGSESESLHVEEWGLEASSSLDSQPLGGLGRQASGRSLGRAGSMGAPAEGRGSGRLSQGSGDPLPSAGMPSGRSEALG